MDQHLNCVVIYEGLNIQRKSRTTPSPTNTVRLHTVHTFIHAHTHIHTYIHTYIHLYTYQCCTDRAFTDIPIAGTNKRSDRALGRMPRLSVINFLFVQTVLLRIPHLQMVNENVKILRHLRQCGHRPCS